MWIFREFLVKKNERGLLFKKGDFEQFLLPGKYRFVDPLHHYQVETFDLAVPEFEHPMADFILKNYPQEMEQHFIVVNTTEKQIGVLYKDDCLTDLIPPSKRVIFWRGWVDIRVDMLDIVANPKLPDTLARVLFNTGIKKGYQYTYTPLQAFEVSEHHLGLLYDNDKFIQTLDTGLHAYWRYNHKYTCRTVDTRVQEIELAGQEILTKDKVTLRINLSATYQVTDILQVDAQLADFSKFLYRELQFGLRAIVGTHSLDELLENKTIIDEHVFEHMSKALQGLGININSVGVKDIILPGEMRDILTSVVEAEKAAQANIIRRREETAATRSLLNTAKVMEGNPTALRLKELETLERVTESIDSVSVYGGLDGLLKELVKLK